MEKKIRGISQGDFERDFPLPAFEPERIEEICTEGYDYEGSLVISGQRDASISGIIYSSSPYVTLKEPEFSGQRTSIAYTVHISGFFPGEKIEGHFTIVSDGYENTLPYVFTVEERPVFLNGKKIQDLKEFAEAAEKDQDQAAEVFASSDFRNLLVRHFYDTYLSYRAITAEMGFTRLALESFLTANGLKEAVNIHVFPENLFFFSINGDARESFRITRNTEGYIKLRFEVPEDSFMVLEKTEATDQDFFGGTLEVPFFIKKDRLHQGVNLTTLRIIGNGFYITRPVTASTYGRGEKPHAERLKRKQIIASAMNSYLDFRLRKADETFFLKSAREASSYFLDQDPSDCFALCYLTMAEIVAGEKKEAFLNIKRLKELIADKTSFEWAFLLYLCTLLDSDEEYIDRITEEIEQIQELHPDDSRIFWFLLFLRKRYVKAPLEKLRDIRQWIVRGVNSPVLYAEALDMLNAYPYMTGQLDSFSLSVLRFGLRRDALSKNLIPSVCECIYDLKTFSDGVYGLASELYQRFMDHSLLEAIVSFLLRTRCIGKKYLIWYKRGIETGLNLTGLFECYLYSVDDLSMDMLPRMLTMYFAYENDLPDDKREFLYANVITYKEKRPSVYEVYLKQIERFAIEKLKEGKISDNLAIIYKDMYTRGFLDKDLLSILKSLKNSIKLICMTEESGELYIFTRKDSIPKKRILRDHYAIIDIDDQEYFPVLVTPGGVLFGNDAFYTERLFPELTDNSEPVSDDGESEIVFAMSPEADWGYRTRFFMDIDPARLKEQGSLVATFSYEKGDLKKFPPQESAFIIRNLICQGKTDEAYSAIKEINALNIADNQLLSLASSICRQRKEDEEEDGFLTSLLSYLLGRLLFNDDSLAYLCRFYKGPTSQMLVLYKYARAREADVRDLCGRIITQMIYEEGNEPVISQVYKSLVSLGGDEELKRAYLTYYSDRYIRGFPSETEDGFFDEIEEDFRRSEINRTMKTALLMHYSALDSLSDQQMENATTLLTENLLAGRYFAFYKKLDISLVVKNGIYERMIIEYRGDPFDTLEIRLSSPDGREKTAQMTEVYDGIYVYTFIMFQGERVSYSIRSLQGDIRKEGQIMDQDYIEEIADSRFGRLGAIYKDQHSGSDALKQDVEDYIRIDVSENDLFSMV